MILHERTPDWDEELEALRQNQTLPADVQQRQMQESLPVLRAHPWLTAAVWLGSIRENLFSRWQYFPVQLPSMGFLQRVLVGSLSVTRYTQLLWYLCLPVLVVGWMRRRRLLLSIHSGLALLIVVGFFVSLSGGTYWAGSRILYPVEFVLHILMVAGLLQIFQYVKGLIAGQPDNQQR